MKLFKIIYSDGETHYCDLDELMLTIRNLNRDILDTLSIDSYLDFNDLRIRRVE